MEVAYIKQFGYKLQFKLSCLSKQGSTELTKHLMAFYKMFSAYLPQLSMIAYMKTT